MGDGPVSSRCLDAVGRAMRRLCCDQEGGMLVFVAFGFMVMVGTAALAVDISRLYMLQNKLQVTADAAALAGAGLLPDELEAHAAAMNFAQLNLSGANDGAVVTDADVEVGYWDKATRSFVVAGEQPANAVRVSARRSATNSNPVSNYFARILGFETADLGVQTTAGRKGGPVCVIALDPSSTHAIRVDSNAIIDIDAKANAENGIESVRTNSQLDERYGRRDSNTGEPYFVLKAANQEIIGASEMYSSAPARSKGIESVKANLPQAYEDIESTFS